MAEPSYLVAFEKGHYLPDRPGEPWAVRATVPAHAIAVPSAPGEHPPRTAACGARVSFVVDRTPWPPMGVARCASCSQRAG